MKVALEDTLAVCGKADLGFTCLSGLGFFHHRQLGLI